MRPPMSGIIVAVPEDRAMIRGCTSCPYMLALLACLDVVSMLMVDSFKRAVH